MNIVFPGAGSPGANIWHIRTLDPTLVTELSQANSLIAYIRAFYNSLAPWFPATTVISLGTVTDVTDSREIVPTMSTVTGTGVSSAPQLLALCVTWKTSIAARRGRGRTFVGPLCIAAMQGDGTPVSTLVNDAGLAGTALVNSSVAFGNGAIGIYGYRDPKIGGKENPRNPLDPKVFRDVTGRSVRDIFASLRSRRD